MTSPTTDLRARAVQLAKFGTVGLGGVVVNLGVFHLLRIGPLSETSAVLGDDDRVLTAKVIATLVSILYAWVAHRLWTFRGGSRHRTWRELTLFAAINGAAIALEAGAVAISHYGLGLQTALADNIAALIGIVLGTAARWFGYNLWVFDSPASVALVSAGPRDGEG